MAFKSHFQEYGIHVDQGIDGLQRPALLFPGPLHDFVRDGAHRLGRDLVAVEVLDMGLDVPRRHPLGVHRDDLLLQPGDIFLVLLDDPRLKIGLSIPRNIQVDLTELGFDGLGREAVFGAVGGLGFLVVFFVAQMVRQLPLEERFDDTSRMKALKSSRYSPPFSFSSFLSSSRSRANGTPLIHFTCSRRFTQFSLHSQR
jgi:hypothetical protein